jgi:hypothetical protein
MPQPTFTQSIPFDLNALGTTAFMTTAAAPDDV